MKHTHMNASEWMNQWMKESLMQWNTTQCYEKESNHYRENALKKTFNPSVRKHWENDSQNGE